MQLQKKYIIGKEKKSVVVGKKQKETLEPTILRYSTQKFTMQAQANRKISLEKIHLTQ